MSKPILTYFDGPGRAQQIRIAFQFGGIDFEDKRIKQGDASFKEYSPSRKLPVLEIDGKKYVESLAILMYAGRRAGLLPTNPVEAMKVSQIIHYLEDLWASIGPCFLSPEAQRSSARSRCAEQFTKYFGCVEKILEDTFADGHSVGGKISVADINLHCWYAFALENPLGIKAPNLDKYTKLKAIYQKVKEHPKFVPFFQAFL